MFEDILRNNDIALLEDEIASLKGIGFHSVAEIDVEAALNDQSEIINQRKRIVYLRNEKTLTSLKQKVESDGDNSAEAIHLQNEIRRLSRDIANYLEDELKNLEDAQFKDEVAHIRHKIFHTHIEIIEHLQRQVFDILDDCEPQNYSRIFRLRKEMNISLVKVFACFADYPNDVEMLNKDIDDMDEHNIMVLLTNESDREEFTDVKRGEEVALNNGKISYKERKIEGTHVGNITSELQSEIDDLRVEVVRISKERLECLERRLGLQGQQKSGVVLELKVHIDTLQAEIVRVEKKRLAYKQKDVECRSDLPHEYNVTISSLKQDIIALNKARIEYREREIEHIQEEHSHLDCELSPRFNMQIDTLRAEIISLKTQVLRIHESDIMILNYVHPRHVQPLQIYELKDDIGVIIDRRIAYQKKVLASSHVDQKYAIKLKIESLVHTKSHICEQSGYVPRFWLRGYKKSGLDMSPLPLV